MYHDCCDLQRQCDKLAGCMCAGHSDPAGGNCPSITGNWQVDESLIDTAAHSAACSAAHVRFIRHLSLSPALSVCVSVLSDCLRLQTWCRPTCIT